MPRVMQTLTDKSENDKSCRSPTIQTNLNKSKD